MTVQWSTSLRNALLDQWETSIGTTPKVQLRSGAAPANCAAAASGTLIAEFTLASDWCPAASDGVKSPTVPLEIAAAAGGTVGHYRIVDSAGTTCHEQGTVTATGGGGDMTLDNPVIAQGQNVQITSYSKTAPGA